MVALFLALSVALLLVSWAELAPTLAARLRADEPVAPVPPLRRTDAAARGVEADPARPAARAARTPTEEHDVVLERLAALLADDPAPMQPVAEVAALAPAADAAEPAAAAKPGRRAERPAPAPEPAPEQIAASAAADAELPRVTGYRPGDVIELELEGPAPRREDIRFEQAGKDTRVVIEGFPALILARAQARNLTPAIFRFRSPQLA